MLKKVAVKTDIGNGCGSGHAQRALTLVRELNDSGNYDAGLVMPVYPASFPETLKELCTEKIPSDTGLIIRDMRDSSADEINQLKKTAPVAVIDDIGEGRDSADFVIDLLPNKKHKSDTSCYYPGLFLFGFDFIQGINAINEKYIKKEFDIAFYPGYYPDKGYVDDVTKIFPENTSAVILSAGDRILYRKGETYPMKLSYAEALAASKVLITHFGVSLYEGSLCGCTLMVINPSEYHRSLTAIASEKMELNDLGLSSRFDEVTWAELMKKNLAEKKHPDADITEIKQKINTCSKAFVQLVDDFFRKLN